MTPGLDTSKYAVIYPRQSSQDQVENNVYSLERQMQLKELAMRDGFHADQVLVVDDDLGMSGRSIERRPGFSRALKMINEGIVAAIYVEDLTRLSRDDRTIDQMIIADACERSGTMIFMGRSWFDMRDSGQRQSYKYQAVGASESWKAHLDKLHGAQRHKASQGKAAGQHPRGYRPNKEVGKRDPRRDQYVVYEPEAAIIRALAEEFPKAGSLYKLYDKVKPVFWPDGSEIKFSAIRNYLKSEIHRGHFVWGNVRIPDAHEAIIPPALASEIDHVLTMNRQTTRREGSGYGGELAGLVSCKECARPMYTIGAKKESVYQCCERAKDGRNINYHRSIRVNQVDPVIQAHLWKRLQDGAIFEGIIARIEQRQAAVSASQGHGEEQQRILQRKIDGWMKSLGDPDLPAEVRKLIQGQLSEALKQLDSRNNPARQPMESLDLEQYRQLMADPEYLGDLPFVWQDEPLKWRRSFIRRFIEGVEIKETAGKYHLKVTWLDGEVTRASITIFRPGWSQAEWDLLNQLLERPDCPAKYGRTVWLSEKMGEAGLPRTKEAIQKRLKEMGRRAQDERHETVLTDAATNTH